MSAKIVFGLVATIVLGIGGYVVKSKFTKPKGVITYAALGVGASPSADDLYRSVGKDAKRWMRDATFWSLNFHAVRLDGTVDTSKPINIAYVSPSNSASASKRTRSSSLRKYAANPKGLKTSSWGWNAPVKDIEPHPQPQCTIKQLMSKLSAAGTIKGPVRVMFEPKLASYYAWTVYAGGDKPISYSWQDCSPIQ